jgi:hypothetical protein
MSLHAPIAEVVHELLLKNPAESWQSLDMAKSNSEQPASLDVDRLDPELGIGPEEIIAATVVSLFMSDREQAAKIAESAFRWARGWIKASRASCALMPGCELISTIDALRTPKELGRRTHADCSGRTRRLE